MDVLTALFLLGLAVLVGVGIDAALP